METLDDSTTYTDKRHHKLKLILPQVVAGTLALLLQLAVGVTIGFSGILIPAVDKSLHNGTEVETELYATRSETSWLASIALAGTVFGSLTGGLLSDLWGRLFILKLSTLPFITGWILMGTATSISVLMLGRFLTGWAASWAFLPSTVFVSEVSNPNIRGSLSVLTTTLSAVGLFICIIEGWFLHWKTVALISIAFVLVPSLLFFTLPESPPWLISKGRINEAIKSLKWLYRYHPTDENTGESYAEKQLKLLHESHQKKLESQAIKVSGKWDILKEFVKPTGYKPTLILIGLYFFQLFSGIYIILFYNITFFQDIASEADPFLASAIGALLRMITAFPNSYLLKAFKRRTLLMVSSMGMALCMSITAYLTSTGNPALSYWTVAFNLLHVVMSNFGLLSIPWTLPSEMYPLQIRGAASSVCYCICNIMMFISVQSYYGLLDSFNGIVGVQWFFATVAAMGCAYTYIFIPETHGKTLDEISNYFKTNTIYVLSKRKEDVGLETKMNKRFCSRDIVRRNEHEIKLMDNSV